MHNSLSRGRSTWSANNRVTSEMTGKTWTRALRSLRLPGTPKSSSNQQPECTHGARPGGWVRDIHPLTESSRQAREAPLCWAASLWSVTYILNYIQTRKKDRHVLNSAPLCSIHCVYSRESTWWWCPWLCWSQVGLSSLGPLFPLSESSVFLQPGP